MQITISKEFRKKTIETVLAILLFLIVYSLLILAAILLTILCCYIAFVIVTGIKGIIGFPLGLGMASVGFFVLYYLFKFLFVRNKVDRSHLIQVFEYDEPELMSMIKEIADKVDTKYPKAVYLSADVNASVIYDSSFWSMFFPVRKNLIIGMGLINTVSKNELKAILAHEFGHFSQSSMKIGSYVYHVNHIIYSLLYENPNDKKQLDNYVDSSPILSVFRQISMNIIEGIQGIMRGVYNVVNRSYMRLSREMEFHADAIAANVTGSDALINSLRRMSLSDYSFNNVIGYYQSKMEDAYITENIYPQQFFVMEHFAKNDNIPFKNHLPIFNNDHIKKYNKSKLIIINQWASHPETEDRVSALQSLGFTDPKIEDELSLTYFRDIEKYQKLLSAIIFQNAEYTKPTTTISTSGFIEDFNKVINKHLHPEIYNGYYDQQSPMLQKDLDLTHATNSTLEELYSSEKTELFYEYNSLIQDIDVVTQIANGTIKIKSFEYDGHKQTLENCLELLNGMRSRSQVLEKKMKENEQNIHQFFKSLAEQINHTATLAKSLSSYEKVLNENEAVIALYNKLLGLETFMHETNSFETIKHKFHAFYETEEFFRAKIKQLLSIEEYLNLLDEKNCNILEVYASNNLIYFINNSYDEIALSKYTAARNALAALVGEAFLNQKKQLLDTMAKIYWSAKP